MQTSPYNIASRFIGLDEVPGNEHNPQILAMLRLDQEWPEGDEVPWCSAFVNYVAWLLRLPRSKSLRARSWLNVGYVIDQQEAEIGCDVVILSRGPAFQQPGPEVINAPGHVGFFAGQERGDRGKIYLLGGNQNNTVSIDSYDCGRILGVRRLYRTIRN